MLRLVEEQGDGSLDEPLDVGFARERRNKAGRPARGVSACAGLEPGSEKAARGPDPDRILWDRRSLTRRCLAVT